MYICKNKFCFSDGAITGVKIISSGHVLVPADFLSMFSFLRTQLINCYDELDQEWKNRLFQHGRLFISVYSFYCHFNYFFCMYCCDYLLFLLVFAI